MQKHFIQINKQQQTQTKYIKNNRKSNGKFNDYRFKPKLD